MILLAVHGQELMAQHAQSTHFTAAKQGGGEIVAVFITGPCCEAIVSLMKPGIDRMRQELGEEARRAGVGFRMVGVTTHWAPEEGWEHLKQYGSFDEVSVGSNWMSLPIETLIWRDGDSSPSVPQVLIYQHDVAIGQTDMAYGKRTVIQRVRGWKEIQDWRLEPVP